MKLRYNLVWIFFMFTISGIYRLCFRIAPSVHPDHVPYFVLYALIVLSILEIPCALITEHAFRTAGKSGRKKIIDMSGETGIYLWGMMLSAIALAISVYGLVWTFLSGETSRQIFFSSGSFLGLIAVRIRIQFLLRELIQDKK